MVRQLALAVFLAALAAASPASQAAAQSGWSAGKYRNPVTFTNDTGAPIRINWIYDPAPQVLSTLTLEPGAAGLLPMPPADRLASGANLQVEGDGRRRFRLTLPLPGQPGPAHIRVSADFSLLIQAADRRGVVVHPNEMAATP